MRFVDLPQKCALPRGLCFSPLASPSVNRERKRKQRKTTAEKELLFSSSLLLLQRGGRARESKDFWFVLFSSGESVFWPTRGYIHSSLSLARSAVERASERETAGGRPPLSDGPPPPPPMPPPPPPRTHYRVVNRFLSDVSRVGFPGSIIKIISL